MAIGFRGGAAIASGTGDPTTAPGTPTGLVAGDLVIMLVGTKAATPPTANTPAGWTAPANNTGTGGAGAAGVDTGPVRVTLFYREAVTNGEAMPTVDLSAAPSPWMIKVLAYSKLTQEVWDPVVCAVAGDTTGSATSYDPAASGTVISFAAGDWLGYGDMINGDAGTPTLPGTLTVAGVILGAGVSRANDPTTTGNDGRLMTGDFTYVSGTASGGPDRAVSYVSANASMCGVTVFYRLRVTAPPQLHAHLAMPPRHAP